MLGGGVLGGGVLGGGVLGVGGGGGVRKRWEGW